MKTFKLFPAFLLALGVGLPAVAQDEDSAADLQSFSVGDRRNTFEPEKITIERPTFNTNFKMETPKPSLGEFRMAKPKLEIMSGPVSDKPATTPTRTASASGAVPGNSGQTSMVRPLRMDPPSYPREALRRGEEGHVVVEFTVNAQGTTEDISVVDAEPRGSFENEARRAVAGWTFEPAMQDGRPVAQRIRHTLEFTLTGQ